MSEKMYYAISTYGATRIENDRIVSELEEAYPIQEFNNGVLRDFGGYWDDMEESLGAICRRYPHVLFHTRVCCEGYDENLRPVCHYMRGEESQCVPADGDQTEAIRPKLLPPGVKRGTLPEEFICRGCISVSGVGGPLFLRPHMQRDALLLLVQNEDGATLDALYLPIMVTGSRSIAQAAKLGYTAREIADKVLKEGTVKPYAGYDKCYERDLHILQMFAEEQEPKDIAEQVGLSRQRVKKIISRRTMHWYEHRPETGQKADE